MTFDAAEARQIRTAARNVGVRPMTRWHQGEGYYTYLMELLDPAKYNRAKAKLPPESSEADPAAFTPPVVRNVQGAT